MSRHTAGPWEATDLTTIGKTLTGCPLILDASGNRITVVEFSPIIKDFEELQANARLIAAAPELLEALESAIGILRGHQETPEKIERYTKATAVIAKAKGEQP
jgi:hypothetical protein